MWKNLICIRKKSFFKQKWEEGLDNLNHMIFYGSSGIGKYSQVLYFIKSGVRQT